MSLFSTLMSLIRGTPLTVIFVAVFFLSHSMLAAKVNVVEDT